jgi:hypothetical protein
MDVPDGREPKISFHLAVFTMYANHIETERNVIQPERATYDSIFGAEAYG